MMKREVFLLPLDCMVFIASMPSSLTPSVKIPTRKGAVQSEGKRSTGTVQLRYATNSATVKKKNFVVVLIARTAKSAFLFLFLTKQKL